MPAVSSNGGPEERSLREVVTLEEPLGPPQSEALVDVSQATFSELYDETNSVHRSARLEDPFFIVGRKGSGKTAFLIGTALADEADVVLIKSEDVYLEVNKIRARYEQQNGVLAADNLVHVWEVLLFHAAMLQIGQSDRLPNSDARQRLWSYLSALDDPASLEVDGLLARVGATISDALLAAPQKLSFREACWSIDPGKGTGAEAAELVREVLSGGGPRSLYVVIDNLEDLHRKLDAYADVVTALFRVASRSASARPRERLPFRTRFAFPAELLPRLRKLAANPEKDFRKRLTIRWTASELIVVAGNRLRTFIDLYFSNAAAELGLPERHDPADAGAAERTLRALLPSHVTNALGGEEDPVAYLMRHTQLLPRHLIIILNEIMSHAVNGQTSADVPHVTSSHIIAGVHDAERLIADGILTTYEHSYPHIGTALEVIKNRVTLTQSVSRLHKVFNEAGVARSGLAFDEFLEAGVAIGAFGVVNASTNHRYVVGDFSYTYAGEVRPVEDRDEICVHPLFVSMLFDRHAIQEMAGQDQRPIYPYGSDPDHGDPEV
jgi:hypothetical protein